MAMPLTLTAVASSGLPVAFTASGNCSLAGAALTVTGAGSCAVTASQDANVSYNPAPGVTRSFAIAKADPVLSWPPPAPITFGTALGAAQLNATAAFRGAPLPARSGAAHGEASAACSGTVIKSSIAVAVGEAVVETRAGLLTHAGASAVGVALAACPPTRIRGAGGTAAGVALVACDSVRVKDSAAAALGSALASGAGRRIRTSPLLEVHDGRRSPLATTPGVRFSVR